VLRASLLKFPQNNPTQIHTPHKPCKPMHRAAIGLGVATAAADDDDAAAAADEGVGDLPLQREL
jgi:hypothetical protein